MIVHDVKIKIGGTIIGLRPEAPCAILAMPSKYAAFLSKDPVDIDLAVCIETQPLTNSSNRIFDSGTGWQIHKTGADQTAVVMKRHNKPYPSEVVVLSNDLASGRIFVDPRELSVNALRYPLLEPLDALVTMLFLSRDRGILIHACGINLNGQGLLFIGDSGIGKSTLASLWANHSEATVLSDDQIIVRSCNGQLQIHGTPWHSQARATSPSWAPLKHIFFIEHAVKNQAFSLPPLATATQLIAHSFPPHWDRNGMTFCTAFSAEIAQNVSSHRLGFVPDPSVLDTIECVTYG
jgi:hypothetical protein